MDCFALKEAKMFYEYMVRPLLFKLTSSDPERAHDKALSLLKNLGRYRSMAALPKKFFTVRNAKLEQEVFGLKFQNPVGLAAGFDKNVVALPGLQALGFGFLEAGTVTRYQQNGYDRPRIFRFPKEKALINRMGFPNDGADKISDRLAVQNDLRVPLGINLGKSMITLLTEAAEDYIYSLRQVYPFVDYIVINVSSPNTPGLVQLQDKELLGGLISALFSESRVLAERAKIKLRPILVKISPDLSFRILDELLEVCLAQKVAAIIAGNTTIRRSGLSQPLSIEGGLSGEPLFGSTLRIVKFIYERTKGKLPIIGAGGISGPKQAYEILRYANLIQLLTGLVYQGPFIVRQINQGLLKSMKQDGIKHISELRR